MARRRALRAALAGALLAAAPLVMAVSLPGPARAQGDPGAGPLRMPLVVLDQDRLFTGSTYGKRLLAEIETRAAQLSAENREIEEALTEEEQALTERRAQMSVADFRDAALAFDEKVKRLRAEQDAKGRALANLREAARQRFFGQMVDELRDLMRERGAVAMLDRRAVLISTELVDITPAAIARADAILAGAPIEIEIEETAPAAPDAEGDGDEGIGGLLAPGAED